MRRLILTGVVAFAIAAAAPGSAYELREEHSTWAEVSYYQDPEAVGAAFSIGVDSKGSYGGVPPMELGGAGGADVCLQFEDNGAGIGIGQTCTETEFSLLALESAHAAGAMEVRLIDQSGEFVGVETVTYDVTFTGTGGLFPGASTQTDPEPALGLGVTLLRDAVVEGQIDSPSLGSFVLAGRRARLGRWQSVVLAPLAGV